MEDPAARCYLRALLRVCHEGEMSGGPAFGTPSILNYKMSHPVYINYVYYIYENSVYLIA